MEDRIKIGDEWYIKESTVQTDKRAPSLLIEINNIIRGKISIWENDSFCFEGFHNIDTGELESIEFTDKRKQSYPFTEIDFWDNKFWFKDVLDLKKDVFQEFGKDDTELIEAVRAFINIAYKLYL